MPKEDNDKSAEDLFPPKWSGWYWYDDAGIAHPVKMSVSYNPQTDEVYENECSQSEKKSITYNPITKQGDCRTINRTVFNTEHWQSVNPIRPEPKQERYCFFLDIDGTLLKHYGDKPEQFEDKIEVLPAVKEFFALCGKQGHKVILTSGRRESFRKITEKQLRNACISYDELILGCTNAIRVLVNDTKPYREDSPQTAIAFNLVRDEGVQKLVDFLKGEI